MNLLDKPWYQILRFYGLLVKDFIKSGKELRQDEARRRLCRAPGQDDKR